MREKIYALLNQIRPECNFLASEDFLADGLLESLDIVLIVNSMEEEFGIKIDAFDIVPENFNSLDSMLELVRRNGGV